MGEDIPVLKYRIYRYTCRDTQKSYIGCSCISHQSTRAGKNGRNYVRKNGMFGKAIQENGWDSFDYDVIGYAADKDVAYAMEQTAISLFNTLFPNGYNLEDGGVEGHSVHVESREKLILNPLISNQCKKVIQYDLNGNKLNEFYSIEEAARSIGVKSKHLSSCLHEKKGYSKTLKGYKWKFANVSEG